MSFYTAHEIETNIIFANVKGTCFGGGYRWYNATWDYNIGGCWAFAEATAGADSTTVQYFQSGVGVGAFILSPTALWKPKSGDVALGLTLPIMLKNGDYDTPQVEGFTLEDTNIISIGYQIEADWMFKVFKKEMGIYTKIGKIFKLSSSMWELGLKVNS